MIDLCYMGLYRGYIGLYRDHRKMETIILYRVI